jgi:hypothetical protein
MDYPHKGERTRTAHKIHKVETIQDMEGSMPRIYASLKNNQVEYKSCIIEVEGEIDNYPITILIDTRAIHNYINSNIVETFHLQRSNHKNTWFVQLAIEDKRKINRLIKDFPIYMNGIGTKVDVNIIPLGL